MAFSFGGSGPSGFASAMGDSSIVQAQQGEDLEEISTEVWTLGILMEKKG